MKLTRIQQIGLAILVCSLFPAYFISHWRYEAKLTNLDEMLQKEQALHTSTDKLLNNCENNPALKAEPYDAAHRICSQGADIHARTEHEMAVLNEYKAKNEMAQYWNFGLAMTLINLVAFILYKVSIYLKREND